MGNQPLVSGTKLITRENEKQFVLPTRKNGNRILLNMKTRFIFKSLAFRLTVLIVLAQSVLYLFFAVIINSTNDAIEINEKTRSA